MIAFWNRKKRYADNDAWSPAAGARYCVFHGRQGRATGFYVNMAAGATRGAVGDEDVM